MRPKRAGHIAHTDEGEVHTGFWWGNLREEDLSEDPRVDRSIILNGSSSSGMRGMDWIDLAQGRDRWRALVKEVMNFLVP
jgi:hypothetical protein